MNQDENQLRAANQSSMPGAKKGVQTKFSSFVQAKSEMTKKKKSKESRRGLKKSQEALLEALGPQTPFTHLAKRQKKNLFELSDDDEQNDEIDNFEALRTLTHNGKALGDNNDDYQDELDNTDEDEEREAKKLMTEDLNFSGFDGPGTKKKSRKELYEEIIKKSKKMKHERQKTRMENKERTMELNEEFDSIRSLLKFTPKKKVKENEKDEYENLRAELERDSVVAPTPIEANVDSKFRKKREALVSDKAKDLLNSDDDVENVDIAEMEEESEEEASEEIEQGDRRNLTKFEEKSKDALKMQQLYKNLGKSQEESSEEEYDDDDDDELDDVDLDDEDGDEGEEDEEMDGEGEEEMEEGIDDEEEDEDEDGDEDIGEENEEEEEDNQEEIEEKEIIEKKPKGKNLFSKNGKNQKRNKRR